jgi:Tfp pilus assembly PilM family ATPase
MMKFTRKRTGWIGVDVGTSHLKVVQLVRGEKRLRLAAAVIVPRSAAWNVSELTEDKAVSSADEMGAAMSLCPDFRGRRVAATLPMSLCQIHQMEHSASKRPQRDRVVRQEIESANQRSAEHLQFATWPAELDQNNGPPVRTNVLAVPRVWTDQLCEDIAHTGWSCQLVDGLPLALARAVKMVHDGDAHTPWAALDWGYSQATFCVVVDGRAVYVRRLKDCSLQRLLDSITEELKVTGDEALRLLQEHGLPGARPTEACEIVAELISEPLDKLQQELARTISHLRGQRRTIVPQGVYLFGGGATLKGLAEYLTEKLELEHRVWQFGGSNSAETPPDNLHTCMFGPAVALSALAWEKS